MRKVELILLLLTMNNLTGLLCNLAKKSTKVLHKVRKREKEAIKNPVNLNDTKKTEVFLDVLNKKKTQTQNLRILPGGDNCHCDVTCTDEVCSGNCLTGYYKGVDNKCVKRRS